MAEINYPGERADEVRRQVGEGLLDFLTYRGVIDPPEPEVEAEQTPVEPSFRQQAEQMKYDREQSLARLLMAGMASAIEPQPDTQTEAFFGPAAAERERNAQDGA
jgi:hypothetical protein